jgi:hypothetical protein
LQIAAAFQCASSAATLVKQSGNCFSYRIGLDVAKHSRTAMDLYSDTTGRSALRPYDVWGEHEAL